MTETSANALKAMGIKPYMIQHRKDIISRWEMDFDMTYDSLEAAASAFSGMSPMNYRLVEAIPTVKYQPVNARGEYVNA